MLHIFIISNICLLLTATCEELYRIMIHLNSIHRLHHILHHTTVVFPFFHLIEIHTIEGVMVKIKSHTCHFQHSPDIDGISSSYCDAHNSAVALTKFLTKMVVIEVAFVVVKIVVVGIVAVDTISKIHYLTNVWSLLFSLSEFFVMLQFSLSTSVYLTFFFYLFVFAFISFGAIHVWPKTKITCDG